ncbi:MAG TPA: aminotransferase class V-fold PLP-dependent enzyme [Candidatus Limnocylindrales bacterium]
MASPDAVHWTLDPTVAFLNHGSFGAAPRVVQEAQRAWRDRMEREPVRFLDRELDRHLAYVRERLGAFIGARPEDLAFVSNATTGVNTVLQSLRWEPGDELLSTDHEYNATLNALRHVAARDGARVVIARIPFPIRSADQIVDAIVGAVTPRTRLALVSHITSTTALVMPVERIVRELAARGVDTLLDAAHAPGQVPLDLDALGAAYTTGNAHKWLCAPKGAAFLHVRADRRDAIRPLVVSHGANERRTDRTRFRAEFDWTGTADPSAVLAIPTALDFLAGLRPGGWPELMASNRALALAARGHVGAALGIDLPAPDAMIGAMAALPLPGEVPPDVKTRLYDDDRIEVPVSTWPVDAALEDGEAPRARLLRISAQAYNDEIEYMRLAAALRALRSGVWTARSRQDAAPPDGPTLPQRGRSASAE